MLKIALTGGIGTGKSYLSHHFVEMGIPVYHADDEAKKMYELPSVKQLIYDSFGDLFFENDTLNYAKMAHALFSDNSLLERLNKIIHPMVMDDFMRWAIQQQTPSVMMESAIIFEGRLESFFDKIIVVDAPLDVRIKRIQLRNPLWTDSEIRQRIDAQIPQKIKCERADLVLFNG